MSSTRGGRGAMTKTPITLQDLRRRLYVKAKAEPSWRFWGLYTHVCKPETLHAAYELAKQNDGAPGTDGVTFEAIEVDGVEHFLDQLREELVQRSYRPQRPRKVGIPKEGGKVRQLSIPKAGEPFHPLSVSRPSAAERGGKGSPAFDSVHSRPGGQGCAQTHPGTDFRSRLSTGVVRLPAEEVSAGGGPTRFGRHPAGQDLRH